MTTLLDRPLVPVANPDDAEVTYEQLRPYLLDAEVTPLVVHVIEKGGGVPDKAGLEQREMYAEETLDRFRDHAKIDRIDVETKILYGTDIATAIYDAAEEADASAVVFTSRGGNRWLELLSGNIRSRLVTENDRPVIVLPRPENR